MVYINLNKTLYYIIYIYKYLIINILYNIIIYIINNNIYNKKRERE